MGYRVHVSIAKKNNCILKRVQGVVSFTLLSALSRIHPRKYIEACGGILERNRYTDSYSYSTPNT